MFVKASRAFIASIKRFFIMEIIKLDSLSQVKILIICLNFSSRFVYLYVIFFAHVSLTLVFLFTLSWYNGYKLDSRCRVHYKTTHIGQQVSYFASQNVLFKKNILLMDLKKHTHTHLQPVFVKKNLLSLESFVFKY